MRLEMQISFKDSLTLPLHHNHILQGFIYNNLSSIEFRNFLHDRGFRYEKRNFKFFTFSKIFGKFNVNREKKAIKYGSPIKIIVSSVLADFINDFTSTVIGKENVVIGSKQVKVDSVKVSKCSNKDDCVEIKTSSPITVYSTIEIHNKRRTIYHAPGDDLFEKLIFENLKKKYSAFCGENIKEEDFSIKVKNKSKLKFMYSNYRGFIIKGWEGNFELYGNPELIEFAYDVGLGSKNAQGFGSFFIKEGKNWS